MREYKNTESKFRFVSLAAKRAKQLLKGAKPKIKTGSKNLIRIAQEEIHRGLIDYRVLNTEREMEEQKASEAVLEEAEAPVTEENRAEEASEDEASEDKESKEE